MNRIITGSSSFIWQKEQRHIYGSSFKHFKRYRTFNRSQPLVYGCPHSMYQLMKLDPSRDGYKSFIRSLRKNNKSYCHLISEQQHKGPEQLKFEAWYKDQITNHGLQYISVTPNPNLEIADANLEDFYQELNKWNEMMDDTTTTPRIYLDSRNNEEKTK